MSVLKFALFFAFLVTAQIALAKDADQVRAPDDDEIPLTHTQSLPPPKHPWFTYFQVGGIYAFQSASAYEFTGEISWNPTVCFSDTFCLRGNFGAAPLKNNNNANTSFVMGDFQLFTSFYVDSGYFEAGGGGQYWAQNGNLVPVVSGNLAIPIRGVPILERFFIGYTACFSTVQITHEFRLGLGVAF